MKLDSAIIAYSEIKCQALYTMLVVYNAKIVDIC